MLNKITEKEAWVYFGYLGCTTECPKALQQLPDTTVGNYFVNIIPGLNDQDVQQYIESLGLSNVTGIQASRVDLQHIEDAFSNMNNGRIGVYNPVYHSNQWFHLKKDGLEWKNIAYGSITSRLKSNNINVE